MDVRTLAPIASRYGLHFDRITREIDSSRPNDKRLNLIVDDRYVVRFNDPSHITEQRLAEMERLVCRYNSIGVHAPHFLRNTEGCCSILWNGQICYVTEYLDELLYSQLPDSDNDRIISSEMLSALGLLASRYTGIDLCKARSMWSIIDLSPLDTDVDEKQENLNSLTASLREYGDAALADQLKDFNYSQRNAIRAVFSELPRCVYQGDLNGSNVLVRDGHFHGLIDFNLSGTEVNINCFLCETERGLEDDDPECYSPAELLAEMVRQQDENMQPILAHYTLNETEQRVLENYRSIIMLSQYPKVCTLQHWLREGRADYVCALLRAMLQRRTAN